MSEAPRIRVRPTGATATMGRNGFPHVVSATGGEIAIKTGPSEAGFNPLDLLYASLSACLAISVRIAAGKLGVLDRLTDVAVEVKGEKAKDEPSRIARFDIDIQIAGDFDEATRREIARLAEADICTVSNTIRSQPEFDCRVRNLLPPPARKDHGGALPTSIFPADSNHGTSDDRSAGSRP